MSKTCSVPGCIGRNDLRKRRKCFSIPSERNYQGKIDEKKLERRNLWFIAIYGSLSEISTEKPSVCEIHFVTGKPVHEEDHTDWVPSLHMPVKLMCPENTEASSVDLEEVARPNNVPKEIEDEEDAGNASMLPAGLNPSISTITPVCPSNLANKLLMHEEEMAKNQDAFHYYTGLKYELGIRLLKLLTPVMESPTHLSTLTPFQEFILTMMKLRLGLQFTDLGYRFNINRRTASRIFYKWIDVMYYRLRSFVRWPSREEIKSTMPASFKEQFGDKITVIIDCFSIYTEKSINPEIASQTWSRYKHHNCIKYLIGITPQGCISFISKAYVGRASDTFITHDCGILENLQGGDFVLADRGFLIEESVGLYMAELVQPAFTRGKAQLHPHEVENTRTIANVRIHVERVIGVLRMRYKILSQVLPHNILNEASNEEIPTIDKILTVCCAFINNSNCIV